MLHFISDIVRFDRFISLSTPYNFISWCQPRGKPNMQVSILAGKLYPEILTGHESFMQCFTAPFPINNLCSSHNILEGDYLT